jgi:3-mercaptopropionate dioxygenase
MAHALDIPERLLHWCMQCSAGLRAQEHHDACIEYIQAELPGLLCEADLFRGILASIVEGDSYPDIHTDTMFASEIVLFRDLVRGFSLRMCLWGPGEFDPVHDHNSWGVIGTVSGCLEVINYKRLDDGSDDRHAAIEVSGGQILPVGSTYWVLPLNHGLHRTGNPDAGTIVQVGVYGKNLTGRNYVNAYDMKTGEIFRLYSPQQKKRMLAREALLAM